MQPTVMWPFSALIAIRGANVERQIVKIEANSPQDAVMRAKTMCQTLGRDYELQVVYQGGTACYLRDKPRA